jgi:hypothetical protein
VCSLICSLLNCSGSGASMVSRSGGDLTPLVFDVHSNAETPVRKRLFEIFSGQVFPSG